ncbi:MAG TPA: histidine phosphatase family protein [Phycisphaerales bacterium]|nr:histidine phosphatase family protein [Phycisphaerales bacterium]
MRLYIVRHGKATDAQPACSACACGAGTGGGEDDFSRGLTGRGQAQARFLAARIAKDGRAIATIVSSRFPRALQTAHAIQRPLACDLLTDVRLEVDHEVSEALEIIRESENERDLMLVGHNPQLGELISVLCSGLPPQELILKTGEMVVIDIRPSQPVGSGKLVDRARLSDSAQADDTVIGDVESLVHKAR